MKHINVYINKANMCILSFQNFFLKVFDKLEHVRFWKQINAIASIYLSVR